MEAYTTPNRLVFFILLDFAPIIESICAIHKSGTEYLSFMIYLHSMHWISDRGPKSDCTSYMESHSYLFSIERNKYQKADI